MNKFILCSSIFLFIILSFTSAQNFDYKNQEFKQGEPFNFLFPCVNNGTYCSSTAICSATAIAPNSSIFFSNVTATRIGTLYNITRIGTFDLGYYHIDATCNDNGQNGIETIYAKITPTGRSLTLVESIFYVLILLVLIFTTIFTGVRISRSPTPGGKVGYFLATYLFSLFAIFLIYRLSADFIPFVPYLNQILFYFFIVILIGFVVAIIGSIGYLIIAQLNTLRTNELIKRGHTPEQASTRLNRR